MVTNKLLDFADFKKFSDIFIESGSHSGTGIQAALNAGFRIVKSVEYDDNFHRKCQERFANQLNVDLWHGTSEECFPEILKLVDGPAVFWLDGHPSGPGTGGHDDFMAKGLASEFTQDKILTKEIDIILAHRTDHIILIDDQYGENPENIRYRETLLGANPNYKFYFYDRQEGPRFYKNKSLACIPE